MEVKYLTARIIHPTYRQKAINLYQQGYSTQEIKEELEIKHGVRQIQRWMKEAGVNRSKKAAFRLAMSKGRVSFFKRHRVRRWQVKII
jgi:transposase-like protein